jgi:hypothetical protein
MEMSLETGEPPKRGRGRPPGKYGKYRPSEKKIQKAQATVDLAQVKLNDIAHVEHANKIKEVYSQLNRDPINPGELKRVITNLAEEARKHAGRAIDTLVELTSDDNANVRLNAATALLDRGFGKAAQSVELKADVQSVNLNVYQDLPEADQRIAGEVLGALSSNPASLALALDIMAEPDIVVAPFADDQVIDAEVIEVVPVRAGDAEFAPGEVIDVVAVPTSGDGN